MSSTTIHTCLAYSDLKYIIIDITIRHLHIGIVLRIASHQKPKSHGCREHQRKCEARDLGANLACRQADVVANAGRQNGHQGNVEGIVVAAAVKVIEGSVVQGHVKKSTLCGVGIREEKHVPTVTATSTKDDDHPDKHQQHFPQKGQEVHLDLEGQGGIMGSWWGHGGRNGMMDGGEIELKDVINACLFVANFSVVHFLKQLLKQLHNYIVYFKCIHFCFDINNL